MGKVGAARFTMPVVRALSATQIQESPNLWSLGQEVTQALQVTPMDRQDQFTRNWVTMRQGQLGFSRSLRGRR